MSNVDKKKGPRPLRVINAVPDDSFLMATFYEGLEDGWPIRLEVDGGDIELTPKKAVALANWLLRAANASPDQEEPEDVA